VGSEDKWEGSRGIGREGEVEKSGEGGCWASVGEVRLKAAAECE
jgi:hypothetical protein